MEPLLIGRVRMFPKIMDPQDKLLNYDFPQGLVVVIHLYSFLQSLARTNYNTNHSMVGHLDGCNPSEKLVSNDRKELSSLEARIAYKFHKAILPIHPPL